MRCQLQRLILHKFSYLEEPSLSVTGRHKIYEEVTRLVYPDTQLAIAAEADSIGPVDELTRDKQELTAAMHRFAVIVHKVSSYYERNHETKHVAFMDLCSDAYDEPVTDSENALSYCNRMGCGAT